MEIPYRLLLANNVRALMALHGKNPETLKAVYLDGTKKGEIVGIRSIRNLCDPEGPSVGIDILAAVAARLKVQVYHLLVPGLDPASHPAGMQVEDWIEAEVERRVVARLRVATKARQAMETLQHEGGRTGTDGNARIDGASSRADRALSDSGPAASADGPKPRRRTTRGTPYET